MKDIINTLITDGIAVIKNAYTLKQIEDLKQFSNELYEPLKNLQNNNLSLKKETYTYETHFDIERVYKKNVYYLDNRQAIEVVKGRYDISYNTCNKDIHTLTNDVISHFMKKKNRFCSWGLLTSSKNSKDGHWHRDTVNLNGEADEEGKYDDKPMLNLEPFYFTVLIPLVPLNKKNGTPEFIKGSHKLTYKESINKEHLRIDTELGDIIIFDGRIFHRGCANHSQEDRPVLYNMIHRKWYVESGK